MPDLFIITGSNGAGKSTIGKTFLPVRIQDKFEIFDGDRTFMQKHKELFLSRKYSDKAARQITTEWMYDQFDLKVKAALKQNLHFAYEGHLPQKDNWKIPQQFKKRGYKITLIFLGLANTDQSALRVFERAKNGGHNVPPYEIERNFYGNLMQLNKYYSMLDELQVIDTSETIPRVMAIFNEGIPVSSVAIRELPEWVEHYLPALYNKIFLAKNPLGFK